METKAERVIRILLVDSHELVRSGIRMLIERHPGLQVVSETTSRAMTLMAIEQDPPDIILLNLDSADENGLSLISELRRRAAEARILVLTGVRDRAIHQEAVRLGAVGLLLREHSASMLVQAILHVNAGRAWLEPELVASVLSDLSRGKSSEVDLEIGRIAALTERERTVITLICEGLQNKTIAQRLSISDTTVRHHLTSIFNKLDLENRLELVIYAYRNGLARLQN